MATPPIRWQTLRMLAGTTSLNVFAPGALLQLDTGAQLVVAGERSDLDRRWVHAWGKCDP